MGAPSQFEIGTDEALGTQGESEWARLCLKLQEGNGFNLVFLFSASARSAQVLRRRMEAVLREEGKSLQLMQTMPELAKGLAHRSTNGNATWGWVEATGPDAWAKFLAQLEAALQTVRQKLPEGLVISALPLNQRDLDKIAPHLKAACSLFLEPLPTWLRPLEQTGKPLTKRAPLPFESRSAPTSLVGPQNETGSKSEEPEPVQEDPAGRPALRLLKQALEQFGSREYEQAAQTAQQALELSRSSPDQMLRARILHCLACVEKASARNAEALEHVEQALESANGFPGPERVKWFDLAAQLRLKAGDWLRALQHCREGAALARLLGQQQPGDLLQRDFAVILSRQGEACLKQGDAESALPCLEESLEVRRGLLRQSRTVQTMRDVSYALYQLGIFQVRRGELEAAHKLTEESLYLDRKIIELFGATRPSVRDYAASLRLTATILERLERKEPARLRRRQAERLELQLKGG